MKDQPLRHARNRSIAQRGRKWWRRNRHLASIGSVLTAAAVLLSISIGIAAWRGHQNQVLMATANAASFHDEFVDLRLPLTPLGEAAATMRQEAVDRIKQSIRRFGAANDPNWQQSPAIRLLSPEDRLRTLQEIGELCFLMASRNHATLDANTADQNEYAGIAAACLLLPISPGVELRSTNDWQFSADGSQLSPAQQLRLKAIQETTQKRYGAALPLLVEAIQYEPNDPMLWLLVGLVQREHDDLSSSELSLTRCIALAPNSPFGYFQRGVTRLAQERFAEADDDFSTVLVLRPATPEAHFDRAIAGKGEKKFDQAFRDCTRAVDLGWTGCRIYLLRSEICASLGDVEAAAADRRRGISETPQDSADWYARGMAQVDDDHDAAIADLERAVELDPRSKDAMQNLANIYAEVLFENEEALKWMERVEAIYPDYATAPASKAVLLARLSRDEEAGRCIDRALELSHSAETYYLVASAYAQMAARAPELADQAVDALRACLNQDRSWFGRVIYDVDFTPIKTNPNLNKILAACNVMINGESANEEK